MTRRLAPIALLMLAALTLGGCVTVERQSARQGGVGGPVDLEAEVSTCLDTGSPPDGVCEDDPNPKQLLVGFRVGAGFSAPDELTTVAGPAITLRTLASYAEELQRTMPAPEGERWVGYGSTGTFTHAASDPKRWTFGGRFEPNAGAPLPASFAYATVAGARYVGGPSPVRRGTDPVRCGADPTTRTSDYSTHCVTSKLDRADLPLRDIALAGGGKTRVLPARTVAVPFSAAASGSGQAAAAALTASTSLPGARTRLAAGAVAPAAGGPPAPVGVELTVPPRTPAGSYTVTLSATLPSGAVRTATTTVIVEPVVMRPLAFATRTIRIGRGGTASLVGMCPVRASVSCAGELELRAGRVRFGRTRFEVPAGKDGRIRLKLPRRARRELAKKGYLRARATVALRDLSGVARTDSSRLLFKGR